LTHTDAHTQTSANAKKYCAPEFRRYSPAADVLADLIAHDALSADAHASLRYHLAGCDYFFAIIRSMVIIIISHNIIIDTLWWHATARVTGA
jgi:hypothetical protein